MDIWGRWRPHSWAVLLPPRTRLRESKGRKMRFSTCLGLGMRFAAPGAAKMVVEAPAVLPPPLRAG